MKYTYKYLFAFVLCVAATTALAQEGEVYSLNVVGFQKMGYESGLELRANPFDGQTIREVVGNDGVYGTSPTVADNVLLYDSFAQGYVTYYLRSHSSIGRPEWITGSQWATNVYIDPGRGYFYRSRLGSPRTNVVAGDVVLAAAVTNTVRPGLQLFAYPFTARTKLSDLNLKDGIYGTSPTVADNIMLWNPVSDSYTTYYLRSHSSIGHPEWITGSQWATNVYVEPGQGFWFRSRSASPYEWVENTPYPDL